MFKGVKENIKFTYLENAKKNPDYILIRLLKDPFKTFFKKFAAYLFQYYTLNNIYPFNTINKLFENLRCFHSLIYLFFLSFFL